MSSPIIEVRNLFKLYHLGQIGTVSLKEMASGLWDKLRGKKHSVHHSADAHPEINPEQMGPEHNAFWALKDVSFDVQQGEVLGVIGSNGAGKSTLLKILSRITEPTSGYVKLRGRVASLLEVGTGFHEELTGRHNIYLNGAILGMSRREIDQKLDEIVDFSGVEKFLDTPVKRYSSGMRVRLAFAVAAHLEPEILIIDEVLAVGDVQFQKKCIGKLQDISNHLGRTVLFVSHNMGAVRLLCNNAILLSNGSLTHTGKVQEVADLYLQSFTSDINTTYTANKTEGKDVFITQASTLNIQGKSMSQFNSQECIVLSINFYMKKWIANAEAAFHLKDSRGMRIFTSITELAEEMIHSGMGRASATIPAHVLIPGKYTFTLMIFISGVWLDMLEDVIAIEVMDAGSRFSMYEGMDYGCVLVNCKWKLEYSNASSTTQNNNV